ncbi:MAG: hypothetical protein E7391_01535 [Ruminococcaceae bacterium]|nr:hypothetical protein [Oscillospiraceae bacterium]
MKKLLCLVLSILMVVSCFSFNVFAETEIKVIVNGNTLTMDQNPIIVEGRTLVPLRAIFEALGATVEWDDATKTASGKLSEKTVSLQINNTVAKVNGKDVTLDVPAQIVNSRTLVPVRFISESLGANVGWEDATKTVTVDLAKNNVRTFDDEAEFLITKDNENVTYSDKFDGRVGGGGGSKLALSISSEEDHTSGSGKSLKMENVALKQSRVKFFNTFGNGPITEDMIGNQYKITLYLKAKTAGHIMVGMLAAAHTDAMDKSYETQYYKEGVIGGKAVIGADLNANEWTKVEFDYTIDALNASDFQIGMLSIEVNEAIDVLYIDDILVEQLGKTEIKEEVKVTTSTAGIPNVLANPTDKRPVPTKFEKSNRIDDLLYFPMPEAADVVYSKLEGGVKVLGEEAVFDSKFTTEGIEEYGAYEMAEVTDGIGFTKVLRFTVNKVPSATWKMNFRIYPEYFVSDKYEDDDVFLIKAYIRRVSGGDIDTKMGAFEMSFINTKNRSGGARTKAMCSDGWSTLYLPLQTTHAYCGEGIDIGFNPGIYNQVVEIGGFEVINYGKKYTLNDMPNSYGSYEGCEEDAQWRKDALARIEQVRRGDIKVIVKDENGNIIPNADVKVEMYEHEIMLSMAGATDTKTYMDNEQYRKSVVENFNSLGTEGGLHRMFEDQTQQITYTEVPKIYEWAKANGMNKALKGHALIWDTDPGENVPNLPEYKNTKIGTYLDVLNDKDALDAEVKAHFEWIGKNLPIINYWDVSNEDGGRLATPSNQTIKNVHGKEVLVNWYKYAREALPHAKLLLTDGWTTPGSVLWEETQGPFFWWAVENLDFDIIGDQGHTGYTTTPENIVKRLDELSKAGKPIHITEFDTGTIGEDQNYQGNLVRDALIAYFACENVEYIQLWGHRDWSSKTKTDRIMYEYDWTIKPSGKVFQDLFYNKWWTKEAGKTDANGEFNVKGYFGDYTVTATANGKTVSVDVPCYKGNNNTIEIVVK